MSFSWGGFATAAANGVAGGLQGLQQARDRDESQRRYAAQQARDEQDHKDKLAQQLFTQGIQTQAAKQSRADFAMNADANGYSPYTPGMTAAYSPPGDPLNLYGDVGPNGYEAKAAKDAETFGGWVKTHLSGAEQQAAATKQQAEATKKQAMALAISMGISPEVAATLDPKTVQTMYEKNNTQDPTQVLSGPGMAPSLVNKQTGVFKPLVDASGRPAPMTQDLGALAGDRSDARLAAQNKGKYLVEKNRVSTDYLKKTALNLKEAGPLRAVLDAVESTSPLSDVELMNSLAKVYLPGQAVSVYEMQKLMGAMPLGEKVQQWITKQKTGNQVPASFRTQIAALMRGRVASGQAQEADYQQSAGADLRNSAGMLGVEPLNFAADSSRVAPDHYKSAAARMNTAAPAGATMKPSGDPVYDAARAAIATGANPAAVIQRYESTGKKWPGG